MKKVVLVVFHKVDYDGIFSYAIARQHHEAAGCEVKSFAYNYRDELDEKKLEKLMSADEIVLGDISFPLDLMLRLKEKYGENMTWVDHHVTAINDSIKYGYDDLSGVRDSSTAACRLMWEYYNPGTEIPESVKLAASYDIWDKSDIALWDERIAPFQLGLKEKFSLYFCKFYEAFVAGLDTDRLVENGRVIQNYNDDLHKSWCNRFSFEVTVNGSLRGIAMITPVFTSLIFKTKPGYDVYVCLQKDGSGDGKYNVSMYTDGTKSDFSCGKYLKENYNGGGHDGAAGGYMTEEQFIKIITKKEM